MEAADDHGHIAGHQRGDQARAGDRAEELRDASVRRPDRRNGADEEQVQADGGVEERAAHAAS